MKYKGIKIEDNVSTYKTEKVCEVFGDINCLDVTNEIRMTNKEFSAFVDKLVKVRDKFKERNDINFIINVFEGYHNCEYDDENTVPSICINTEEEIKESPEEREKRIERQKKLIDKHIEESEKQKRQIMEEQEKDAIRFLESLGYKVI